MAEDVTMFTDESVHIAGPIRPGPSLHEWAHGIDDATLADLAPPELIEEIRGLDGMTFPTRLVQSVYLDLVPCRGHRLIAGRGRGHHPRGAGRRPAGLPRRRAGRGRARRAP